MPLLSETELQELLEQYSDWSLVDGSKLEKIFNFKSYMAGVEFVTAVANIAEKQNHHPDMTILYKKVIIRITSHDLGGITERDLKFLRAMERFDS